MSFPDSTATNDGSAGAIFQSAVQAAGLDVHRLGALAQLQLAVANLLTSDPTTVNIPAGDILSGTFGANKTGGADTGDYTFPASVVFGATATSTTALATPSALLATTFNAFASTVSGAVIMGFGTTNDVALKNRAGTTVLGVGPNTTAINIPGTLLVSGNSTLSGGGIDVSAAATTVTIVDATAAAFKIISASGTYLQIDARTTAASGTAVTINSAAPTIASAATNRFTIFRVEAVTINFSGTTSITGTTTSSTRGVAIAQSTVNGTDTGAGLAITEVHSMLVAGPPAVTNTGGQTTTVTRAIGFRVSAGAVNGTGGVVTDAWAFRADAPTGASTGNYAAFLNGPSVILATSKLHLDGSANGIGGDTYILETSANQMDFYSGGANTITAVAATVTVNVAAVFSSTVRVNGVASLGTAAGTNQTVIDGTAFGAGVASIRFNGLTTAAVTNQTGTLLNAPVAGNPTFWMPVSIAGTVKYLPCW